MRTKDYQVLVGSLTYAAIATKPDIAVALNVVSQFAARTFESRETHPEIPKRDCESWDCVFC